MGWHKLACLSTTFTLSHYCCARLFTYNKSKLRRSYKQLVYQTLQIVWSQKNKDFFLFAGYVDQCKKLKHYTHSSKDDLSLSNCLCSRWSVSRSRSIAIYLCYQSSVVLRCPFFERSFIPSLCSKRCVVWLSHVKIIPIVLKILVCAVYNVGKEQSS